MTSTQKMCLLISSLLTIYMLASCETVTVHRIPGSIHRVGHGPPAHAQAHGYHRKHIDGLELVYDSTYGVYAIVGMPDHYYCNGHYYRMYGDIWEVSIGLDTNWAPATRVSLPSGLKAKTMIKSKRHNGKAVASAAQRKGKHK
jgi:hypothetical protein